MSIDSWDLRNVILDWWKKGQLEELEKWPAYTQVSYKSMLKMDGEHTLQA